ncbi:hypothetical protein M408DRAFT_24144 [Serendipita vermifera MAFF 305830]|uniref:Uncharacterized protein n=1 Tax=Serendipita vermifera MAFF 305830 TaxID=933852 RepID=A0A0C2XGC0_SERVB|nr:hypothetical protein M408DRAFT_24144 [Serendipita vermifera MAFF 305830]
MVFYPDNIHRAGRLQQLVNSMANLQADISHAAQEIDRRNSTLQPVINGVLTQKGFSSTDDLIAKSVPKLAPEEVKQFQGLLAAVKMSADGFDWSHFMAGLLLLPEGVAPTGKLFISVGRLVLKMCTLSMLSKFFASTQSDVTAATEAAGKLQKIVGDVQSTIKGISTTGDSGPEIEKTVSMMNRLGTLLQALGTVSFASFNLLVTLESIQGAEQNTRLIDAIHTCQVGRLCMFYFIKEGRNISEQLETLSLYLKALRGPDGGGAMVANYVGNKCIQNLTSEKPSTDMSALESILDAQDRAVPNYYSDDDLSHDDVVSRAN